MAAGLKVGGMKRLFKGGLLNGVHVGLHTAEPTSSNELVNANSDGYSRKACTLSSWTYSSGVASYGADLEFDDNAASAWQTAAWAALWDSDSGGNLLMTWDITNVTPASGSRIYIASGSLQVDLDVANSSLTAEGAEDAFVSGLFSAATYIGFIVSGTTEVTGTSYARTQVAAAGMTVNATTGVASNVGAIISPAAGAGDWTDPGSVAIYDKATGGNLLAAAAFTTDIGAPANGQAIEFAIGALTANLGVTS